MSFRDALIASSPALLGLGAQLSGRSPVGLSIGLAEMQQKQEDAQKREAIKGLLAQSGIGGLQRGLLEQLPIEQQAPAILNFLQQQEALRRSGAASGAAAARAAQEQAAYADFMAQLNSGAAPQTQSAYNTGVAADFIAPSAPLSFGEAMPAAMPTAMPAPPPVAPSVSPVAAPGGFSFGEVATPAAVAVPGGPLVPSPVDPRYSNAKAMYERLMGMNPLTLDPPRQKAWEDAVKLYERQMKAFEPPEVQGLDYDLANTYRDDLKAEPEVQNFRLVRQGFDVIETLYQNPGAVSDYALAVGFAKIVDPGSVAREGEVAAVQGSTALSDRLKQQVINALNGTGALPEESRAEIADLAAQFYNRNADRAGTVLQSYRTRAERAGLPFDEIWSGGAIDPLPDDWMSSLTINPNAKDRFTPPSPPVPGPVQGPPTPPPPMPSAPPTARTMGDAMLPTQDEITAAVRSLTEAQMRTLARIKGAENQVEYLRRLGKLK